MAVDVRFEVWTRPESGTFVRKFPLKDVVNYNLQLGMFGRGTVEIPINHPNIDDIIFIDPLDHTNDAASIIRAFIGETPLYHFYAVRMPIKVSDTGQRTAVVTGGGPGTALDRVKVRQFDYPLSPSLQPDWSYGGSNTLLGNPNFEDNGPNAFENADFDEGLVTPWRAISGSDTNELDEDLKTTTDESHAGTHSLEVDPGKRHSGARVSLDVVPGEEVTIDGFLLGVAGRRYTCGVEVGEDGLTYTSTNPFVFNDWHLVELGNVARNTAHNGLPGGSATGGSTWDALGTVKVTPGPNTDRIEFQVQDDHHDDTNGDKFYLDTFTATGLGIGLAPWKPNNLTTMDIETTIILEGAQSAKLTGPNDSSMYQDIDGMTVGVLYSVTFKVRHDEGSDKDIGAEYSIPGIDSETVLNTVTVSDGVFTEVSVTWTAIQATARVSIVNKSGGVITWYVDKCSAAPGYPPATFGKISGELKADADTDHAPARTALSWLVETYTDTLDSDAVAWDGTVAFSIARGQDMRRVITFHGDSFEYEARIKADPADDSILNLDLYNPLGMGVDFTSGDAGAITSKGLVGDVEILRREPLATYWMMEGDALFFGEDRNTVLETVWGEIEGYSGSEERSEGTLDNLASKQTTGSETETIALSLQDPPLVPGIDYDLGDLTMLILGESMLPKASYRVISIDIGSGDPEPLFQVQLVSEGV